MQCFFVDCVTERLVGYSPAETAPSPSTTPLRKRKSCQGCWANNTKHKNFVKGKKELVKRIFLLNNRQPGHCIQAFCLMTNHIPLAIQGRDMALARIIQNISSRYTRWVYWRGGRTGPLFEGGYKAGLVDAGSYLLGLTPYIHLNPVRSRIVREPENYPFY